MSLQSDLTVNAMHPKRLQVLASAPAEGLLVNEIFASIQGESTYAGLPCTFVRLTACNLRCRYCDTRYAFHEGTPQSLDGIVAQVRALGLSCVEITGGEPLLQANVHELMRQLCDLGFLVLLETSGSLDIRPVDARVIRIIDIKTPSSGEMAAMVWANLDALRARDEIKFVLGTRDDYLWAKEVLERFSLAERCTVLMGPVFGRLAPKDLAAWIIEDRLPVRMQLQLHKCIWDPNERGV